MCSSLVNDTFTDGYKAFPKIISVEPNDKLWKQVRKVLFSQLFKVIVRQEMSHPTPKRDVQVLVPKTRDFYLQNKRDFGDVIKWWILIGPDRGGLILISWFGVKGMLPAEPFAVSKNWTAHECQYFPSQKGYFF